MELTLANWLRRSSSTPKIRKSIEHPEYSVLGNKNKTITDSFCADRIGTTKDGTTFTQKGGLAGIKKADKIISSGTVTDKEGNGFTEPEHRKVVFTDRDLDEYGIYCDELMPDWFNFVKGAMVAEANRLGKSSFAFAFYIDRPKAEPERGVTIACTTKEFYTERQLFTIIDAPVHRNFIKNMIIGASQADVAIIMVPCDVDSTIAVAGGNHKAGEIQGQTRQHYRLINLLGVKQIAIGFNKMDCDMAGYKITRYEEGSNEMR